MQKFKSIEEGFDNEIEVTQGEQEHLSFSQSAILVCSDPDNNSNMKTQDDISNIKDFNDADQNEYEIQEETALLIESIMHPEDGMDGAQAEVISESVIEWNQYLNE